MAQVYRVRNVNIAVDRKGDIQVTLNHPCGCCCSTVYFHPDQIDGLIETLRFAQAHGRCALKASPMLTEQPARQQ